MSRSTRSAMMLLATWMLGVLALCTPPSLAAAQGPGDVTYLSNEFIRVIVRPNGQFTIGTVGGDPSTTADDQRVLVFGYGQNGWTSFTTLRAYEESGGSDYKLIDRADEPPAVAGDSVTTGWQRGNVRVRQVLTLAHNPFTDRNDTVRIATTLTNTGDRDVRAGVRVMIDTMIGDNDEAPFFVPGTGNTALEHEYGAAALPPYWKAFEARDYRVDSLKSQGIITGYDTTPPDRFLLAHWPLLKETFWEYSVRPGEQVGDSAVALYWDPRPLTRGQSITWVTYYGLAGSGGGKAWIDAPQTVTNLAPIFQATLWVANNSDSDFAGGRARLKLPAGLALAPGEAAEKPLPTIAPAGGGQSVTWRIMASGDRPADYRYSADVTFESGSAPLSADALIRYQRVVTPTPADTPTLPPSPTMTPTTTPSITPTETPTVRPSITPTPTSPPFSVSRVVEMQCLRLPWLILLVLLLLALLVGLLLLLRRRKAAPAKKGGYAPRPSDRPPPPIQPRPTGPRPGRSGTDITPDDDGNKRKGKQG